MSKLIDLIVGTRPNFIKIALLINSLKKTKGIKTRLIHTGQHFSKEMSSSFFSDLNLPKADFHFKVKPGSHATQTASIMINYEKVLKKKKSDLCIVVGDVNSTFACAVTAKKNFIKVAHIESGLRSYDWKMPEEVNRVMTDSISDWFFTTLNSASKNLINSGVKKSQIFFVGNTMIDTLIHHQKKFTKPKVYINLKLKKKSYFVLTLHRPQNVDNLQNLYKLLKIIENKSLDLPIIFPVHPRLNKKIESIKKNFVNIFFIKPLPYLEFNFLVSDCIAVLTDSGGISEETTYFKIPCLTFRDNTERPETINMGTNILISDNVKKFKNSMKQLKTKKWKTGKIPPLWDGKSSERILKILIKILNA